MATDVMATARWWSRHGAWTTNALTEGALTAAASMVGINGGHQRHAWHAVGAQTSDDEIQQGNEAKADDLGVCERMQAAGSPHVGEATVFVSWFLGTPIETLLDALSQFVAQDDLDPDTTFFWVCDYVIRQTDVKTDLAHLSDCVAAIGHTVLLLEPWDKPTARGAAPCGRSPRRSR